MKSSKILITLLGLQALIACGGGSSSKNNKAPVADSTKAQTVTSSDSSSSQTPVSTVPTSSSGTDSSDNTAPTNTDSTVTTPTDSTGSTAPKVTTSYDFAFVTDKVFKPYCYSCHSQGVRNLSGLYYDTYAGVKKAINRIKTEAVVNRTMPQTGPLPDDVRAILENWIDGGYPEKQNP